MSKVRQSEQNAAVMRTIGIIPSAALTQIDDNQNLPCCNSADVSATTAISCCC